MTRVALLGSTGSVGCNTLEVIASHPDRLRLVAVAARARIERLAEQVARFNPDLIAVWEPERAEAFARLTGRPRPLTGAEGLLAAATHPDVDVVVIATSGRDALLPFVRAIQAGKRIALASKELLVMAGELAMRLVREHGVSLIPVDSEHAALFQCLQGVAKEQVAQLIITGSGGPLLTMPAEARAMASPTQVLAHPKWRMGPKITVDSATLMNKGLEVIEARWLFDVPLERLQVVIHPEAVVHGLVELVDGTLLAQLSPCDMRLPIQSALSFPERWESPVPKLSLTQLAGLQFFPPDPAQFPCLRLALEAAALGGSDCVALNGANDTAVEGFLRGEVAFVDIPRLIAEVLERQQVVPHPSLDDIMEIDLWSRRTAQELMSQWSLR